MTMRRVIYRCEVCKESTMGFGMFPRRVPLMCINLSHVRRYCTVCIWSRSSGRQRSRKAPLAGRADAVLVGTTFFCSFSVGPERPLEESMRSYACTVPVPESRSSSA